MHLQIMSRGDSDMQLRTQWLAVHVWLRQIKPQYMSFGLFFASKYSLCKWHLLYKKIGLASNSASLSSLLFTVTHTNTHTHILFSAFVFAFLLAYQLRDLNGDNKIIYARWQTNLLTKHWDYNVRSSATIDISLSLNLICNRHVNSVI